jgi:hypothetical protein
MSASKERTSAPVTPFLPRATEFGKYVGNEVAIARRHTGADDQDIRVKPGFSRSPRQTGIAHLLRVAREYEGVQPTWDPVASLIAFEEFVKPALLRMMGYQRVLSTFLLAILAFDVRKSPGHAKLLRVRLEQGEGSLWAWSAGKQDTGMQKTLLRADALALLREDLVSFSAGETVGVQILNTAMAEVMEAVIRCTAPTSRYGATETGAARSA